MCEEVECESVSNFYICVNPTMKKIISLLLTILIIENVSAQLHLKIDSVSKKYTYSEVIQCDSTLSDTSLYFHIKDWSVGQSLNLNRLKDDKAEDKAMMAAFLGSKYVNFAAIDLQYKNKNVIKSEQPETKKIVLNGVYKYTSNLFSCLQTSYTNFDVIIQCKKGKVKITFTNFTIDMYNTSTAMTQPSSGVTLEEFISVELEKFGKPCKERTSEYTVELQIQCEKVLRELKKYLANIKTEKSEDW